MRVLSLDIGTRRTGCAFGDDTMGVPLSLPTLEHSSEEQLLSQILSLIAERSIDHVVLGLPLLLSGVEGSQVLFVRSVGEALTKRGISVSFFDERYTTPSLPSSDPDALAACSILSSFFERKNN